MFKRYSVTALGLVIFQASAACHAPNQPNDESVRLEETMRAKPAEEIQHSSEGLPGPDEAFFAAIYLEQVFNHSLENTNPPLESEAAYLTAKKPESPFDFASNFSDSRLNLMVQTLMVLGDSDKNETLNSQEFLSLRFDGQLLGVDIGLAEHRYNHEFFQRAAGEDAELDATECRELLAGMGPLIKSDLDRKSPHEQRPELVRAWDRIILAHDSDHDGTLSSSEQKELRKSRSQLMQRIYEY